MSTQIKQEKVRIADLQSPDFNVRNHPQKQIDEIIRSVQQFGQFRPIVIDENNVIYSGNGLYEAMKQMGKETVDAYRITGLSDKDKKKLMLADNKTFSLGTDNFVNIENVIRGLGDFDIPGFDEEVLKNLYGEAEELAKNFSYGSITEERIVQINENGSTKDAIEQRIAEQSSEQAAPVQHVTPTAAAVETPEKQEVNRFIVCPHCGEKIYI